MTGMSELALPEQKDRTVSVKQMGYTTIKKQSQADVFLAVYLLCISHARLPGSGSVCILLFPPVQVASHGEPH